MRRAARPLSPQSELRTFKWLTLTHGLGILAFLVVMVGFFWYLRQIEVEGQQQTMFRDVEWAQRTMRLRWRDLQDELGAKAADWGSGGGDQTAIHEFIDRNPDIAYVAALDASDRLRWVVPARNSSPPSQRRVAEATSDPGAREAFETARRQHRPVFSSPMYGDSNEILVELHAPIHAGSRFEGSLVAAFSLDRTLYTQLSREVLKRYRLSIVDRRGDPLVGTPVREAPAANLSYELALDPPGHGLRLRAYAFAVQSTLIERTLLTAVVGLAIGGLVTLLLLWRHARRRLAAEAERDRLFEVSLDPMAIMDRDGRFLRANPAFSQTLGEEAQERPLLDLAHPDDRERVSEAIARLSSGSTATVEFEARFAAAIEHPGIEAPTLVHMAGLVDPLVHSRWLHWSLRRDPEPGSRQVVYAVAHDTTRRKQTETALAAEAAFRRAMDDSMLTGMRATDLEGRITFVNQAFCRMLGFAPEELIGKAAPYPYWPMLEREEHARQLQQALRGESPAGGFRLRAWRKDGSHLDVRMYISPLVDAQGQQTGWITSMTDITEPNRIREELAAAHERFTTVLDELDAAVSVMPMESSQRFQDLEGGGHELLFANRHYRRTFGDSHVGHLSLVTRMAPAAEWAFAEVFNPEVGRWFEVRSRHIRWVDGSLVQMLVATDVTRRREAEERQREQAEKLQQTSRLVTMGEMASSLAHELNQPLTAIANYCNGLSARVRIQIEQGQAIDHNVLLGALDKTAAQAERAGQVIRRIRQFVKRSEPERRVCDLDAIVAEAVGLAEIDAKRQSVRIRLDLAAELPTLHADPILIEQVLLNLMKNGIDAMRHATRRELHLQVRLNGAHFEFTVTDYGQGISPENREKVFESFYTTKAEGMGIGLNICRSIVESHQGRLWVEANPEGGCIFRFTLPVAQPVAQAA